ncbi:MAG: c-type cytochrome [Bdellovibrio sp.]|nr:c-type cytochrome [Bdellovibrio sp.]
MNNKLMVIFLSALVMCFFFSSPTWAVDKEKALNFFKEKKCTKCHSMKTEGIVEQKAESGDDDDGAKKPPDLSKLSDETMKEADPKTFLKKFLTQQIKRGNKKHRKKLDDDGDLDTLIDYFMNPKK